MNLTHGRQSKFLKVLGACDKCPIRRYCSHRELLSPSQRERGCEEVRRVWIESIRKYKRPEVEIIRALADVESKLAMQGFVDGVKEKVVSRDYYKLMDLKEKFLKLVAKYDPGASRKVQVQHSFGPGGGDSVIELDPGSYDSDTLPDPPTVHPNQKRGVVPEDTNADKLLEEEEKK